MSSNSTTAKEMADDDEGSELDAGTKERPVAVSIRHLSKTYPVPLARLKRALRRPLKPPVEALTDVSFNVHAGEIFGLIGRNGAGKTTLTKIVATLVQPTSGSVTVNGFDSVRDEERVRAQVGLATAEERSFYWRLTAQQNLLFFARLYGLSDQQSSWRINELLARFELEEVARRRFGELSTGNKQRLAFARAMLASPPVLLLDEPTRSLDPLAAARMRALINELSRADPPVSILLTSHNLAEVEELCQRVGIISRGRIRAIGTPQSMRTGHKQTERVRLTTINLAPERAQFALGTVLNDWEITQSAHQLIITFTREISDNKLDLAVRRIFENKGELLAVERESATLLDVLESYEREQSETEGHNLR
ncbi:MAG TPA: ABC transporter ATP-binding protein [Pyrinomonadaceae bacterium]|jgi:ABC-2 type transport system ATP-binding protein